MSERPRLFLIDGFSNIFRAYYAIRNLSNQKGEATNAAFGFLQMLRKLLRDERPEYIGVALDVSRQTVRTERYEEYKANRAPMPEDLRPQIPWIRRIIEAYQIPLLELPNYEADDVLGTLAFKARDAGYEVILVSPDKDLMQLVGGGVYQHHTGRDKRYDAEGVTEDFGVPPHQVVDVLALMGDSSDNVPGVPGIGEKGAKKLLLEYESLENLLEHAGEIKRKTYREGLQNHRDKALLSKELVTIHTDLEIPFEPDKLRCDPPDFQALLEICWELDFKTLARELESEHGSMADPAAPAIELHDLAELDGPLQAWGDSVLVGLVGQPVRGLAFSIEAISEKTDAEPIVSYFVDFRQEALRDRVFNTLQTFLSSTGKTLIGHDLKEVLRWLGMDRDIRCRLYDTMLAAYLIRPSARNESLEAVVLDRLHMASTPLDWRDENPPLPGAIHVLQHAGEQVELPRRMLATMRREMAEYDLDRVYEQLEEPLIPVLVGMEERGIELDVGYLESMSEELGEEVADLEETIYEEAGERFNINSPSQLGEILFEKLGYPVLRRTRKTKSYSTGAETLEELAARGYTLPEFLLRFRELTKLKSTYIDAFPGLVAEDGRLHTRFHQAVAATGRLSSAHPNLQNIPIRTELGHRIRKAFRARPGHRLVVADYSQIELRVLAHIAEEESMIEAFRQGEDIHASTAAAVFGAHPALVSPDQRRMAKTINFGIIYGISAWGLGRQLGISKKEADQFIRAYMERYPGVERYTRETLDSAHETGKVTTLYGRIRWLPDVRSRNYNLRENAKRMAINARIQGTAADLLKLAMIRVDRRLQNDFPDSALLLTVHDELVLEVPESDIESVDAAVREEMEGVAELSVPLVVDAGAGQTWYDAKD